MRTFADCRPTELGLELQFLRFSQSLMRSRLPCRQKNLPFYHEPPESDCAYSALLLTTIFSSFSSFCASFCCIPLGHRPVTGKAQRALALSSAVTFWVINSNLITLGKSLKQWSLELAARYCLPVPPDFKLCWLRIQHRPAVSRHQCDLVALFDRMTENICLAVSLSVTTNGD